MTLAVSWLIARKDIKEFIRKRTVLYTVVILPLMISVLFPLVVELGGRKSGGIPAAALPDYLAAFSWFWVIIPAIIPTPIASYSIVGEKVEKSLEPLLASPVTDGEVLLGKSIAAFLPSILATYMGASIFMALMDAVTYSKLGYDFFPDTGMAVILLVLVPLAITLSIQLNVIVSARVNDVRTASQLGGIMFLPFIGIYLAAEIGLIVLTTTNLLYIAAAIAVIDVALFRLSTATFRREEILTKWR